MTCSVYIGSSILSPGIDEISAEFGVAQITSTLGLAIFVFGYAVGPLILSPLTEIPRIGRTAPYVVTLAVFMVLQVPTALIRNFAGFLVLRFVAGFIGSPPMATGGKFENCTMDC
jgi:DHA1 family multidrug resistance protein-like MFS transporter